jgi:hypothetical protein
MLSELHDIDGELDIYVVLNLRRPLASVLLP